MRLTAFQPKATLLIRILWAWWALCSVALLIIWSVAFYSSARYELKVRESEVFSKLNRITEAFRITEEETSTALFPISKAFRAGTLTPAEFRSARQRVGPLYNMGWLDANGRPVLPGDGRSVLPVGIFQEMSRVVQREGTLQVLWSQDSKAQPYLLTALRMQGQYLFANIDFAQVSGPWLKARVREIGFDSGVSYRLLDEKAVSDWRAKRKETALYLNLDTWKAEVKGKRWENLAMLTDTYLPNNFPQVLVTVETVPHMVETVRNFLGTFGLGFALMGAFALALMLAQRGVRQELELAEARSNFTAMVSHELKTPVAAIRMYAEILGDRLVENPDKVAEYHGIIRHEADRLQRLIENLLMLGQIERQAVQYQLGAEDLNALVLEAVRHASAPFPQAEDWLTLDLASSLPLARADHEAALQSITNIIHNAFKYGGAPPRVKVSTRRQGDRLIVEVADAGPGIPPSMRKTIFEPYRRLESEATRNTQGTGLGLALVKAAMEGQGGSVEVGESAPGGAVFRLRFQIEGE